ncbi:hypothetical protein KEJ15_08980 [Candidatus Bathyarchaeota archaeon]|nr:hypothetical protein [Candidatus Bathyarchaeota archaeon]
MDSKFVIVTIGIWLLFMVLAIINAVIRNEIYKPVVGDLAAHQISSIIFMAVILVVTYAILRISNLELSDFKAFFMGTIWLISTIAFEFIAGHYVFGNPWEKLLADYNLFEGRIWSLVLLIILLAPYIANKLR